MRKRWKLFLLTLALPLSACDNGADTSKGPEGTAVPTTRTPDATAGPTAETTPELTTEPTPKEDDAANNAYLQYTFQPDQKHQKIDGFGGAFTWYSDQVFSAGKNTDGLLDAFFTDAKISIIRFKNEYAYHSEDYAENVGPMFRIYEAAAERAASYGEEPTILLSCWSPPANLKSNQSIVGGGSLAKHEDGTYMYEEYAQWWVDSVKFYRDWDIKIDYVSIQNECDFVADYDGCEFAPTETTTQASYAKAFLAVYDAMQAEFGEDAPKMVAPETMSCKPSELYAYIKDIIDTKPESIYGVGYHLYVGGDSDEKNNTVKYDSFLWNFMDMEKYFGEYGYARWQTEFFRGRGLQTAALINNAMTQADMNAYIYWSAVWPNDNADFETGELIGLHNKNKDGWNICGDYYAVRHFSEFIRPGYTRVDASMQGGMDFKTSAYLSEDGKTLVLVVINLGDTEETLQIPTGQQNLAESLVYQSVLGIEDSSKNVLYQKVGALQTGNTVKLPGESITTVVLSFE